MEVAQAYWTVWLQEIVAVICVGELSLSAYKEGPDSYYGSYPNPLINRISPLYNPSAHSLFHSVCHSGFG